jgi:hypothetical protein
MCWGQRDDLGTPAEETSQNGIAFMTEIDDGTRRDQVLLEYSSHATPYSQNNAAPTGPSGFSILF